MTEATNFRLPPARSRISQGDRRGCGVLGGDGVVSADAGSVFQRSDDGVDDFGVVVVERLGGAERLDEVVVFETRDAEDGVAGLSCELHAAKEPTLLLAP